MLFAGHLRSSMNNKDFTVWELPQDSIARFGRGCLMDLSVSADGTYLAAGSCAGVWWYNLTTRQPITFIETERGMIDGIVLCSGQPWLALNNSNKNGNEIIKIWDVKRQQCIAVMEYPTKLQDDPPKHYARSLCFSPTGQWLAASRVDSVIVDIWESLTGRFHSALELSSEDVALCSINNCSDNGFYWKFSGASAFSPDDRLFASSHWSDFISVWDITHSERIICLTGHLEGVHSLSFSPCGQFLAAGGIKGTVQVWETSTWQLHRTYHPCGNDWVDISYAPDGSLRSASISHDQCTITVWDVAQQKVLYTFQEKNYYDAEIYPIHFSNGTHLAFQSDFEVQVKTMGDAESLSILSWELGDLHSLVFSPDGKTLAAGYRQFGGIVLWDVTTHSPQRVVTEPRCHIVAVYSDIATGKFYAAGFPPGESLYYGNTLNLWEIGQSEPIAEFTIPGEAPDLGFGMTYAPATNLLACGNGNDKDDECWDENDPENGAVYVWDVTRGQMRHTFRGKHTNSINYVRFSPDGTRLISRSTDWTNQVWDVISNKEIGGFPEVFVKSNVCFETAYIRSLEDDLRELVHFVPLVFSSSGNLIAGISGANILVWDIRQCEVRIIMHVPLTVLDGEYPYIDPIDLSPCGQYLAFGEVWQPGLKKVPVQLWDIHTGENIATFLGHPTDVQCLAFSPDSTILASGSFDGTILLWDLKPYLNT